MEFTTILENFNTRLWTYHIKVPLAIADAFDSGNTKRVMVSINGNPPFHAAIMPAGEDVHFININAALRKKHRLVEGSKLVISLEKDESEFGMPFPEEFREVLDQEPEGREYFDALTPGKKRNLIYIVNKVKSENKKVEKSIIIVRHLIQHEGRIDFKILNQDLKTGL